jgi:hypothetical protein
LINEAVSDTTSIVSEEDIVEDSEIMHSSLYNHYDDFDTVANGTTSFSFDTTNEIMDVDNESSISNNIVIVENISSHDNIDFQEEVIFQDITLPTSIASSTKFIVSNPSAYGVPLSVLLNQHLRVLIRHNHP